jgi:hypothetical protein
MSYDEKEGEQSAIAPLPTASVDVPNLRRQPTAVRNRRKLLRRGLNINASLSSALEALWSNRLRSLLTILGVIVGVAAVIVAVTITEGPVPASIHAWRDSAPTPSPSIRERPHPAAPRSVSARNRPSH